MNTDAGNLEICAFSVGELRTQCYLIFNPKDRDCIIIDPGDDGTFLSEKILELKGNLRAILLTHGHFDHCMGAWEISMNFPVPTYISPNDLPILRRMGQTAEKYLSRKIIERIPDDIRDMVPGKHAIGSLRFNCIAVPGHTPGGLAYHFGTSLVSGDVLFADGLIGDWSHSYSDKADLIASVRRILSLPHETDILPGHGRETSVGEAAVFFREFSGVIR